MFKPLSRKRNVKQYGLNIKLIMHAINFHIKRETATQLVRSSEDVFTF